MTIRGRQKLLRRGLGAMLLVVIIASGMAYVSHRSATVTEITTDIIENTSSGHIIKGESIAKTSTTLQTRTELVYESDKIPVNNNSSNAAVLSWQQSEGDEGVHVALRTFDGKEWSKWIEAESGNDRPDTAEQKHSAIILSANIHQVQYRFELGAEGVPSGVSPAVDLKTAEIESIDASKGPSIDKPTLWQRITKSLDISQAAFARSGQPSPHIYSRADWGSPEPDSSPDWNPEYRRLGRSIVHHTATTASADSAASVRAIWQYHRYSNGWGDIGYNYLVDQAGRIFQGRYFDQAYADSNNEDVVGGHAYGNNYGTSGIAMLGDFTNTDPSGASINSVARIAAYKLGAYNINPADGSNLIGHRDVVSTACPGARLYPHLGTIRTVANGLFPLYQVRPYSWQHVAQYAYTDDTKTTVVNLQDTSRGQRVYLWVRAKNVGTESWYKNGDYPVRIGTSNPLERRSAGCDESWLSCSRPTNLQEDEVAVGETGTFEFWYKVPELGIDAYEYFNLVAEGSMWMNDPGLHFRVSAPIATYNWQLVSQYAYTDETKATSFSLANLEPGQRVYIGLSARNTGNIAWTNTGDNPVRIGASGPIGRDSEFCDSTWLSCTRPANMTQSSVAPGEVGNFEFWYKAPDRPGEYRERFNLLAESYRWMNDTGVNFYSGVIHPALNTSDTDRMTGNQVLGVNQSITSKDGRYSLIMQGDGNLVLYSPSRSLWSSNTAGRASNWVVMQNNGNLVIYDSKNVSYWDSHTSGRAFLIIQNDGNLVMYDAFGRVMWHTFTSGKL